MAEAAQRTQLEQRLRELEAEAARARAELAGLAGERPLEGLHLLGEAAGHPCLLECAQVREALRLVACAPVPGAPPHVLGRFLLRGEPVLAADLGRALGAERELPLDAHLVVLRAARPVALAFDRVVGLVESPVLLPAGARAAGALERLGLVRGLCRVEGRVLPLLGAEAAAALVAGVDE